MNTHSPSFLSPRRLYWSKVIGHYSLYQVAVQILGAACGFMVVRSLSQTEYAFYTLANAMNSTVVNLSVGGMAAGLSSLGGKVWKDHYRLGQLMHSAKHLQKVFGGGVSLVVILAFVGMMRHRGAPIHYTLLLSGGILLSLVFQLYGGLLLIVPQLRARVKRLQNLDILIGSFRFILLLVVYRIFFNALVAVLIAAITTGVQCLLLRRWAYEEIDAVAPRDPEDDRKMKEILIHQLPNCIFYVFQGQLIIWLITIFGNTKGLAELGALSRLSAIYAVLCAVLSNIILPSYSRCQSRHMLLRRYFQITGIFAVFGLVVIAATRMFPFQCLWMLGRQYQHLHQELFLMAIMTASTYVTVAMSQLNAAKAWVKYSWVELPFRVLLQIALLFWINVSTVRGVILFSIYSNISPFLATLALTYFGLKNYIEPAPKNSLRARLRNTSP